MGAKVRLGIIGCGAVVEQRHLPATAKVSSLEVAALADIQIDRANALADEYNIPFATQDYANLLGKVDAVLIALPHELHAPVSIEFLKQGVHVLCEKPMATSVAEGEQMLEAACQGRAKLAIGLVRRFFDNSRFIKHAIDAGLLGQVKRFEIEDSVSFDQYAASSFFVRPEAAGSGLLFDTGVHVLDLVLWWFGDVSRVECWDDSRGGIEANCSLKLEMTSGIEGRVELSWMRRLKNVIRVYTQGGVLEVPTLVKQDVQLQDSLLNLKLAGRLQNMNPKADIDLWTACFARQMKDFADAILEDRQPFVPGEEGLRSLALIEACRAVREPLELARWEQFDT